MRLLLVLEWLPVVLVRSLDQKRARRGGRFLARWLVVSDHRAYVIGHSKAAGDIVVSAAHGPLSDQVRRIHPSFAPR